MSIAARPTSQLASYATIDVNTTLCDAIGSVHLHGNTSPSVRHRLLTSKGPSDIFFVDLHKAINNEYNIAKCAFGAWNYPMVLGEQRYPDKYRDLLNDSEPDNMIAPPSHGYNRFFPKPIGTGRPVASSRNPIMGDHCDPSYPAVQERSILQNDGQLDYKPGGRCISAGPTEKPASEKILLNEFEEVINSILNLLPTEEELSFEQNTSAINVGVKNAELSYDSTRRNGIDATEKSLLEEFHEVMNSILNLLPEEQDLSLESNSLGVQVLAKRKRLDTTAVASPTKKARYPQRKVRASMYDTVTIAPTTTFGGNYQLVGPDIGGWLDKIEIDIEIRHLLHVYGADGVTSFMAECVDYGGRLQAGEDCCVAV